MDNVKVLKNYKQENEDFYVKINKDLEEIKSNLKYVMTKQEKQKIEQLTMTEVQTEMLRVLHHMKLDLDKLLDRGDYIGN